MFQFPSNGKARVNKYPHNREDFAKKIVFQFPSNGKARVNTSAVMRLSRSEKVSIPFKREGTCKLVSQNVRNVCGEWFQFPSNGKARVNSPHFRPRRAVAPNTPKPNTNCAGLFSHEKLPRKSHKPLWPLNQTRFFTKNGLEPKQALGSMAILNAFGPDRRIAFVFKILREIPKNVNLFCDFF